MQTPAFTAPTLPTPPGVPTTAFGVAEGFVGLKDANAPFAAILRGQASVAETRQSVRSANPASGDIVDCASLTQFADEDAIFAELPEIAATGKNLPPSGKREADLTVVSDDLTAPDGSALSIAGMLPDALMLIAKPDAASPEETMGEAGSRGGTTGTVANMAAQERQPHPRPIASTTAVLSETGSLNAIPLQAGQAGGLMPAPAPASTAARMKVLPAPDPSALSTQPQGPVAVSITAPTVAAVGAEKTAPLQGEVIASVQADARIDRTATAPSASSQLAARADHALVPKEDTSQQESQNRAPTRRDPTSEATIAAGRLPGADSFSGAFPAAFAMPDRSNHSSAATSVHYPGPASAMPDRATAVADVVERLIAAREMGMSALTSVAIGHREFGELTVNIADTGSALDISVTAADPDSQRALVAALHHSDRPLARETPVQAGSSSQHGTASQPQDRGTENQLARDGGGHQPGGEAMSDRHRQDQAQTEIAEAEAAWSSPGGIYV